jgi:tripeptide aminopeptidase
MIEEDRIVTTFKDLVQIDSESGNEDAMAAEMTRRLEELGFEVKTDSYGNLIAGEEGDDPFMLSGHLDTVTPGNGIKPIIDGDRIRSDGSTIGGGDNKAGLAIILEALTSLKEDGTKRIPLEVVISREEEPGLIGAHALDFSMIRSKQSVVFDREGPVNRITLSSPTYIAFDFEVTGRAAHAGIEPENGISAIRIASELIAQLPQGRLDEETTFSVGTIEGGSTRNTVPESATVTGEFRTMNMETLDNLLLEIENVLTEIRGKYPEATITEDLVPKFKTFRITDEDPCTKRVVAALQALGLEPDFQLSGGGSDANVFWEQGISSVVCGMADYNMHTLREYVVIPELVQAAEFCSELIKA